MNKGNTAMRLQSCTTVGVGSFGEGEGGKGAPRLFRVEPGHRADFVLEQSAMLMGCVYTLTQQAAIEQDGTLVWAAHFLSGMAKALTEDVAHSLFVGEG
ncbi:DUF3077 domain-containing protein [Pseudomonas fontis]|uniref:DUF3077 domain-containing protein n=1 Tax=Pseudomonas fontis TaxID=2942633 RepID=A0ABT5NYX0_9PSED|nr:DUF3077 domain-containing protein [Pseudomonas fontis]MDD0977315.1 DUF3077 domain-containing protein [Pseudomonas fontis]MDD0993386.1 DUF3077 domain-containing protein [Pseudomonas fontis]